MPATHCLALSLVISLKELKNHSKLKNKCNLDDKIGVNHRTDRLFFGIKNMKKLKNEDRKCQVRITKGE